MPNTKNKVIFAGTVLIDLTEDTVTAETLLTGITAHDASGAIITGTMRPRTVDPLLEEYEMGYNDNGTWKYQDSTNNHSDVYEVEGDRKYLLSLGATVGTRFRATFLTTNPIGSLVDIKGTMIVNKNNPAAYDAAPAYKAPSDGYIIVTKDNAGTTGLKTWLFDVTPE